MIHNIPINILGTFGSWDVYGIQPKNWPLGGWSIIPMSESEKNFWGGNTKNICRILTEKPIIESLAIRIIIDHQNWKYNKNGNKEIKIKIEFMGDGEPSTFQNGVAWFE